LGQTKKNIFETCSSKEDYFSIILPDVTQMSPRCFLDAYQIVRRHFTNVSKILARCFSSVSDMLPMGFQMTFERLSNVAQMLLKCLSEIPYPNTGIVLGFRAGVILANNSCSSNQPAAQAVANNS